MRRTERGRFHIGGLACRSRTGWIAILVLVGAMAARMVVRVAASAQDVPAAAQRTVWDGVYSLEQAQRGKDRYIAECAGCHASDLSGREGPALSGEAFLQGWDQRTVDDLFLRIRETMPMDGPGRLSPQGYLDVVAFMLQANEFPVGQTELKREGGELANIMVLREKK